MDRGIVHAGAQRAVEWRQAAHAPAWIGVLRSPGTDEHWEWLQQSHCYYLSWAKTQPRQLSVQ